MIELKVYQIRDQHFTQTLQKIMKFEMSSFAAYKIGKILKAIEKEQIKVQEGFKILSDKYLDKADDEGRMLKVKESFSDTDREKAIHEIDAFSSTAIPLQLKKLTHADLEHVKLTPHEFLMIEGLVESEEEEDGEEEICG